MLERNITQDRAWNTWDPASPAALTYLPAGFTLRPAAYSTATGEAGWLTMTPETRLGPHGPKGEYIALQTAHGGTTIGIEYAKRDATRIAGRIRLGPLGEWGLRFWLVLAAGFDPDPRFAAEILRVAGSPGTYLFHRRSVSIALTFAMPPLRDLLSADPDAALADLASGGYFRPAPDDPNPRWAMSRFNAEETPEITFALAAAGSAEAALSQAQADLTNAANIVDDARVALDRTRPAAEISPTARTLHAVGDVVAWNTVWDSFNHRWYTALTRRWVPVKFGGWLNWMNDMLYHALLASFVDAETAEQNLRTTLTMATPEGNLACLLSEHDEWIDRTQPPIASYVLWLIYLRSGSRPMLELAYDTLAVNHRWWTRCRDGNGNGLLEYGTSPTGSGLFAGTKLACKDESTMDNSPLWDDARYVPETRTLDVEDAGLNALLALDAEMLGRIAARLGRTDEAGVWEAEAEAMRNRLQDLWNEERGIFVNRHWDGRWSEHLAPTSFYPLLAGAAKPEQVERMVREHLTNPEEFWGRWVIPSISRDDPGAADNVYWRGRIWPPLNFLVCQGLRRCGYDDLAHQIAARSVELFMRPWDTERHCYENFNAKTGEGGDSIDTDSFYTWGALLPLLGALDLLDVSPWRGLELGDDANIDVRSIHLADGRYDYTCEGRFRQLRRNGAVILRTDATSRLLNVVLTDTAATLTLPPQDAAVTVEFPTIAANTVLVAAVNGTPADLTPAPITTIRLDASPTERTLAIFFRPQGELP